MEMKRGYKQTEAGVIPEGWTVSQLGVLAEIASGTTPSRAMHDRYYRNGSIAWVKTMDLSNSELVVTSETVTELALKETSLRIYPVGTVLVAMYGGFQQIGRTGLLRIPASVNQAITAIQPKPNILVSEYLFATLNYRISYWKNVASSSRKDPNITGQDVRNFPIAYPGPAEQRSIAKALSDVNALLGSFDNLIAKERDVKQAAMQQLLTGQTRLPGFHGEWGVRKIGDFAGCTAGGTPSTRVASYWGGSLRWMSSGELNLKHIYEVEGRITEGGLHNSSTTMLPAKCVLIGLAGQGKTRGTVAMNFVELCTNQSIAAVLPNPAFVPEYLYYNLDARYEELREMSTGAGGRGGLNLKIIKAVNVPFPTVAEQSAIAVVLSDMDAELGALEARRDKTRDLKQAMMQELLTGKTRLVPAGAAHA